MNNNEHIKNLSGVSDKFLIECAKKVMKNSYSKYSKFKVGDALLKEFMDENGVIILEDGDEIYRYTFSEMYPMSFSLQDFE